MEEGKVIEKDDKFWNETMKIYNKIRPLYIRIGKAWIKRIKTNNAIHFKIQIPFYHKYRLIIIEIKY